MRYLLLLLLTFFSTVHAKEIVTYLHTDLQGSVVMQSNVHGEVITENKRYAPYGGRLDHQEEEGDVSYISKKFNHGTGLSYLNARYYDPEIGRFLSVDPVDVLQQGGRHFNRYTYAYNSPYNLKDPDGELPFLIPLAIFIAKEVTGEVFESYTGIPAPTIKNLGKTAISVAIKQANKDIIKGATKVPSSVKNSAPKYARNKYKSVTRTEKKRVLNQDKTCVYCEKKPSTQVDHIRSQKQDWVEGGFKDSREVRSARVNDPSNLAGSCGSCNPSKGSKPLGTGPGQWTPPKDR